MPGNSQKQQSSAPGGKVFIFSLILVVIIILAALGIYCAVLQEQKMQSVIADPANTAKLSTKPSVGFVAAKAFGPAIKSPKQRTNAANIETL